MRPKFLFCLLAISCCLDSLLWAGTTGKIAGRVVDAQTKEGLPGANIIIEGTTLGTVTDLDGKYIILRVSPGVFSLRAKLIGYGEIRYDRIQVSIDKTTTVHFSLSQTVLESGQSVVVTATRPLVERDLTSTIASVNAEVIARLPVDNMHDVVNLQAGVVDGHFRGGRSGEVAYLIDGISTNDVYSGNSAVQVENTSIQEIQIISGTFNAEYGQAMSGIVNVVTKEGGDRYHGSLTTYAGDYVSAHSDIFWNIDAFNPIYNLEGTLNGPVPFTGKRVTFFASGRLHDNEGALYGRDVFQPSDSSHFPSSDITDWYIESHGRGYRFASPQAFERFADSLKNAAPYVAMRPSRRWTGQIKLGYRLSNANKIDYEGLVQRQKYKEYDHAFRYNPGGDFWRHQLGWNNSFTWTSVLNERNFFTVKAARFYTDYKQYVYENPYDSRYVNPNLLKIASGNAFLTGGQQMWHFLRNTTTSIGKLDFTSQATNEHQLKMGLEYRQHRLWLRSFEIRLNRDTGWLPYVPSVTRQVQNNDEYLLHPLEFSAYVQDKIELAYMVVNAGVRYDFFKSDGTIPLDFSQPATAEMRTPKTNQQFSPRFGLSYPISDRGAIHVSYGHFFQIPNFEYLFSNPDFELYATSNYGSTSPPERTPNTIGNAELKPQKTTIYEIGLQQQLGEELSLEVTAYFKDIRNLLGTEILHTTTGIRYARFINRDYGGVKGLTLAFEKRLTGGFGATVDYTYQIARGDASDPASAFLDAEAGREPQKQLVPLNWDRTHSLNLTLTTGDAKRWSASLIGRLGSGLPYTPTEQNVRTAVENSERKPAYMNIDFFAYRNVLISGLNFNAFIRIHNLLDRKNELDVYSDTGRANYTLTARTSGTIFGVNNLNDYLNRPNFYSEPRQILWGIGIQF